MAPKTVFITGANRGIGLGIVRKLLKVSEIEVIIAGARNLEAANELRELAKADNRLHAITVDVANDERLANSVKQVESLVGDRGLNLLINNAGCYELYETTDSPSRKASLKCFDVNAVGSLMASQLFLPLLKKAAAHTHITGLSASRAAILNIGSDCSSQFLNGTPTVNDVSIAYKMSKVAMLSFARSLASDFRTLNIPVLIATIHPGWVLTEMGGSDAEITVEESATDIVDSIERLNTSHQGGLFERKLTPMPF